jgi:hypothetical protein
MKNLSSGFTIPWEDFNQALRGEQIFHAQYCPDNKDVCLGVWLDRWCYCDSYVVAKHGHRKDNTGLACYLPTEGVCGSRWSHVLWDGLH